jgi:hypothetical protein
MSSNDKTMRILGLAFLFQFVTSFSNGVFIQSGLVIQGDIIETMTRIAANPGLMRASILIDMLTALGVIFLGVVLYTTLRKQNEIFALTALAFYILEAGLLAASRGSAYSLLEMSQAWGSSGQPEALQVLAELSMERMHFVGASLHMVAFSAGALIFYPLLDRARIVPRWLSLWGLISLIPVAAASLLVMLGVVVPFAVYLPYVPFELVIGLWILIRGIEMAPAKEMSLRTT